MVAVLLCQGEYREKNVEQAGGERFFGWTNGENILCIESCRDVYGFAVELFAKQEKECALKMMLL